MAQAEMLHNERFESTVNDIDMTLRKNSYSYNYGRKYGYGYGYENEK